MGVIGGWPPLNKKIDIEDKFDEVNFLVFQGSIIDIDKMHTLTYNQSSTLLNY